MLEYDYLIQRNEGNSEVKYAPLAIPKTLPNLVYIEGPNSSGKSTLLNFIALGLHGIENRNLNPVLLEKLKTILNSDHQKINFCFTITDEKNDLKLIAKKENVNTNEIKLYTDFREPFNNDNSTLLERRFIAWVLRKSSHIKVVIA